MKRKLWVISALLLLATLTGLAQTYDKVINCTLTENNVFETVVAESKVGTIEVTDSHVTIDDVQFKALHKKETFNPAGTIRYINLVALSNGGGYTMILSYLQNQLYLVEIWKNHKNCTYYVIRKQTTRQTDLPVARGPSPETISSWGRNKGNSKEQ